MEAFVDRAADILRMCLGGPPEGRPFMLVLCLSLLAFVVTVEHVGLIVGMRRFSTLHAWGLGIGSLALLLGSATLARDLSVSRGIGAGMVLAIEIATAMGVGLVVTVPLLAAVVKVDYFGGVCTLGLAVVAAVIVGTVSTEAVKNHDAAVKSAKRMAVDPRGLDWLTPEGSGADTPW